MSALASPAAHGDKGEKVISSRRERDNDDTRRIEERKNRKDDSERKGRDRDGDRSHREQGGDDESLENKRDRGRSRERDKERKKDKKRRSSRSPSPTKSKRKLEKAAAKAAARREAELEAARRVAEVTMYSATDNPFHDSNLTQKFNWNKKREKEKKMGMTAEESARRDAIRQQESREELAKLNKQRADREVDMQLREEEAAKMARLAESAQMAEWVAREDDFQLEQSRRRAGIRLRENRAKAIDFLAVNLRFANPRGPSSSTAALGALSAAIEREEEEDGWGWADAGFDFELEEPWRIFDNITLEDTEELNNDIRMYLSLEKSPINIQFWEAMQTVCISHLRDLKDPAHARGGRLFNRETESAAAGIVSGLSYDRLVALEQSTRDKLASGGPVDVDFWESVLRKVEVAKAISKLYSIHEVVIKNRLELFKKRQREDAEKMKAELGAPVEPPVPSGGDAHADAEEPVETDEIIEPELELEEEDEWAEEYSRDMSPPLLEPSRVPADDRKLPIVQEEDDMRELYNARRAVMSDTYGNRQIRISNIFDASAPSAADLEAERLYREEAAREPDDDDEEIYTLDDGLPSVATYDWSDRFRPRKPRFFNRVHTGFEWSQYNQTHYDVDNPPPKVVQGYKFNIFYPDLIDKSKSPSYKLRDMPNDPDTQMLIFTAGPPYEDIAFQIVKEQWEHGHRRGFRSSFDRGVLQLYFNFSRSFYRK